MEIRVLRYFLTVAEQGSITKAAETLHITQPTLSRQIAQMEEELGVQLLIRGSRKISLTEQGFLLQRRAEEIIELVDKTEKELTCCNEVVQGKIVIGSGELAAVKLLPEMFRTFREQYPLVSYDLFTANADAVKEEMDKGLVDIGVLLEPVEIDKYDFLRFPVCERWGVLMRPDDPLAQLESISPKDLENRSVILARRPQIQNELIGWLGDSYRRLDVVFTSNMSTNSAIMVQDGLGYSLVVEGAIPFWNPEKICFRPLRPALTATTVLAWKRQQPVSPAVRRFINHAKCFLSMK